MSDATVLENEKTIKRRRKSSLDKRKARAGYFFVAPFLLGVLLVYLPILIDSVWYSISLPEAVGGNFVGLQWYLKAFDTTNFTTALVSGVQELILQVPAIVIFSLFIAVVLNQKMLGRAAFRAIFFIPVILSTGIMITLNARDTISAAAQSGIDTGAGSGGANEIISVLDVEKLFANMKVGGELVTYVVGLVNDVYNIINYSGVQMLIFLAGLQSISPSIYEACQIEGATAWETFWKITFPMISPMILVNAIYTVIDAFTRTSNPAMSFIDGQFDVNECQATAMYWIYFVVIVLILALVAGIISAFVFYQRRD